jgi:hypothetical protein
MTGDRVPAPQREPGADAVSSGDSEYVPVRRQTLDAITEMIGHSHEHDEWLRAAAYQQGRQAHLSGGYQTGFTLGHDTGLSARQDTRGYVHGILDGFQAGSEERHQLAAELLRHDRARHTGARRPDREAEAS